jgi:hypothetical protein
MTDAVMGSGSSCCFTAEWYSISATFAVVHQTLNATSTQRDSGIKVWGIPIAVTSGDFMGDMLSDGYHPRM